MDINKFEEFKHKIERKLNNMEAKASFLHEGSKVFQNRLQILKRK